MTPIVSVIMPVYNGSAYIGKAIESALLQGVPLEIIVIDDGSTDNLDDVSEEPLKEKERELTLEELMEELEAATRKAENSNLRKREKTGQTPADNQ